MPEFVSFWHWLSWVGVMVAFTVCVCVVMVCWDVCRPRRSGRFTPDDPTNAGMTEVTEWEQNRPRKL